MTERAEDMAERRMFAKTIIDSDAFIDMPLSSQALYFHLSMRADDDGFINNPKRIQRMVGASDDDAKLLILKKFIIPFESGIVVIKHWKIHNYIQTDRYKETAYVEEKSMLTTKKNKAYSLVDTNCIQDGYMLDTQVRLGKDRLELGKDIEDEEIGDEPSPNRRISYDAIKTNYNSLCPSLPAMRTLSESRKKAIRARMNQYRYEEIEEAFIKAEASSFLKGGNNRNWRADFDWIMRDANMAKILDGKYDDKEIKSNDNTGKNTEPETEKEDTGNGISDYDGFFRA